MRFDCGNPHRKRLHPIGMDLEAEVEVLKAIEDFVIQSHGSCHKLGEALAAKDFFGTHQPLSPFVLGMLLFVDGVHKGRNELELPIYESVLHGAQIAVSHPLLQNIMAQQMGNQVVKGVES